MAMPPPAPRRGLNAKKGLAVFTLIVTCLVQGVLGNDLVKDLVDPNIQLPSCLGPRTMKYGWENLQNFTMSKRPLVIEQAGWDSARLSSRILHVILTEIMGFKVIYQEYQGGFYATSRRLIAQNITDIAMEIWSVPDISWYSHGSIGYQGRSGMYVPTVKVEQHTDLGIDFWRFIENPKARDLFVKHGQGPNIRNPDGSYICDKIVNGCQKGRYVPKWFKEEEASNFVEMFLPYPGWSSYRYERMIDGLKLNATINWLGSDFDAIVDRYLANKTGPGIIFYSWGQSSRLMFPYDATGSFVKHTADPVNNDLTVDEPQLSLLKATTLKLPNEFPDVAKLLMKFEIRDDEINSMLLEMANNVSYNDAACEWMKKAESRWSSWIPPPPKSYDVCPYGTGRFLSDGLGICLTCPPESFNWKENNTDSCQPCPEEGICIGGATVNIKKGFFLADPVLTNLTTPSFFHCPNRESCCPSGNCTIQSNCDAGFTGLLCTECSDPSTSMWRGKCISCEKTGSSLYLLFFCSLLATFAVLFIPRDELPTLDTLFFFFQVIQLIFGSSLDELLGFGHLKTFLAIASLDMDGIAVDCPAKLSGVNKLLFRFVLPLMFFVNVGILYSLFHILKMANIPVERIFPRYMKGQNMDAIFFKAFLTVCTFALMPLVEASVAILECRTILGKNVLFRAPSIECFKGGHVGPVAFAILIIVLLLGVLPVTIVAIMMKLKRENRITYETDEDIPFADQLLQNLYLQYKPEFMFIEAYFTLERGILVIFFTVLDEDNPWSSFGYILIIGATMFIRIYVQPYRSQLEAYLNREICACWIILLAFKYTTFQSQSQGITPYVLAIMLVPPCLHVLRLIMSYAFHGKKSMERSIEDLASRSNTTTKKATVKSKASDSERVPLSTGNLHDE
ncbi:hypothetical protein HDU67_001939 [Dinochytrium kinnereticum]|nr:hypothetical protein HDU67_001939 [Dinochytrium kinnereticum]